MFQKYLSEKYDTILTRIFWSWLTDWFITGIPLISLISSPTWRVACRWIIPPCIILATMHLPSSFILSVIPLKNVQNEDTNGLNNYYGVLKMYCIKVKDQFVLAPNIFIFSSNTLFNKFRGSNLEIFMTKF